MEKELPRISVNAQYIKDVSFENFGAPLLLNSKVPPSIDVALDVNVKKIADVLENEFEVSIKIDATATQGEEKTFIIEVEYAGIFSMINFTDKNELHAALGIHCPAMLFPFIRRIVGDLTKEGGYQSLMIDPIDFVALYRKKMLTDMETINKSGA